MRGDRWQYARMMLAAGYLALSGCGTPFSYSTLESAPPVTQDEEPGFSQKVMAGFGPVVTPVLKHVAARQGRLAQRVGLLEYLRAELRPLDIVVVRSKLAPSRELIPSHFTHTVIWLGGPDDFRRVDAWDLPQVRPHQADIERGLFGIESANVDVHLVSLEDAANVDEIVILRPVHGGDAWAREKYAGYFERLGRDFDFAFDYGDKDALSCIELVHEVFPEFAIPVRYSTGRHVMVPDDLVRIAAEGSPFLEMVRYIKAPDDEERYLLVPKSALPFEIGALSAAAGRLTQPRR